MTRRDHENEHATEGLPRREFLARAAGGAAAMALESALGRAASAAAPQARHTAPLAMWALTGTLRSDDVCRQLDAFAAAGWGVVLYPRWGLELEYLGQQWFERIRFIVQQAAARAMEVWLYDEFCWPSGHAKGLVTAGHEELQAQYLLVESDGRSRVERVPESANLLMPEATARFLAVTHERYAAAIGQFFGSTVRAIFTDEPSLADQHHPRPKGFQGWRLSWSDALHQALGGDFRQRLASAGPDAGRAPVWRDYWAAYSRVYHEAWTMPIARWCQAHRIAMSGHLLGEHSFGTQVGYYGSLRRQLSEFGIPGIDEISTRTAVNQCEALTLATIAELAGRERMVEVYALGPPSMSMETMRKMVDLMATCGVDRYVLAICPHDLRGSFFRREYAGIYGFQQPWFAKFAKLYAEYVAEAAPRARSAKPLGVPWPSEEELWAAAGPNPLRSEPLKQLTQKFVAAAREAIAARLPPDRVAVPAKRNKLEAQWTFRPAGMNCLRIEGPSLSIVDIPARAELSVQCQIVRGLRINGTAVELQSVDRQFDLSYWRIPIAGLLRSGENKIEVDRTEAKPLRFLPTLILWGDFAVDGQGRLVAPSERITLGDWRTQGYPTFCGTGRYRTTVRFDSPPARLWLDTGGYPARLMVNGRECGLRAWPPFGFELGGAARPGSNEVEVEVTSTLGHLFVARESPPVGLLDVWVEGRA